MTMWRVTVKPVEDTDAWMSCVQQGIIVLGWPTHADDDVPQVRRFAKIEVGDWIAAHVPESHGGGPGMILGVGRVTGHYSDAKRNELSPSDRWNGPFRRQHPVNWVALGTHDLRSVLRYWRGTVYKLRPAEGKAVLDVFGIAPYKERQDDHANSGNERSGSVMSTGVRVQVVVREGGDDVEEVAEIAQLMERAGISVFAMVPIEGIIHMYGRMECTDEKADLIADELDARIAEFRRQTM